MNRPSLSAGLANAWEPAQAHTRERAQAYTLARGLLLLPSSLPHTALGKKRVRKNGVAEMPRQTLVKIVILIIGTFKENT